MRHQQSTELAEPRIGALHDPALSIPAELERALTAAQRERLDKASRIQMGFPRDFVNKELVQGFLVGV